MFEMGIMKVLSYVLASLCNYNFFDKNMQKVADTIKIMLIDDHRSVLWGLEKLIDSEKPKMKVVAKSTNSTEAISVLETVSPDIILTDLDLNGESGVDLIPLLLAKSAAKVLVLTGTRDLTMRDKAMLAGARGIVDKGEAAETILKAIEMVYKGELWMDQSTTNRIFNEFSRKKPLAADDPEQRKIATLTRKERLTAAAIGSDAAASTKQIAERLCISDNTLRNHLSAIYAKLEISTRLELFVYVNKHGINKE